MIATLLFKDGIIVSDEGSFPGDLRVRNGRIREIGLKLKKERSETEIDCSGCFIFPGLINAHDHLEFNLFPRLGTPPYQNAYEWGKDLHERWKSEIRSILNIPLGYRLLSGAWKNLFSGVTTVVHHNKHYLRFRFQYPITVPHKQTFAHSLQFEHEIRRSLRKRKKGIPFIIHLAEGTDDVSHREIDLLESLGGLDDRTVAVHCVAASPSDVETLHARKVSMVWCPSSNLYLFGKSAPVRDMVNKVPVALGTDSTLTGCITLFDELRVAQENSHFTAKELFSLVTSAPRQIFHLSADSGQIIEGGVANLFLIRSNGSDPHATLLHAEPRDLILLMQNGKVRFSDPSFTSSLNRSFDYPAFIQGKKKFIHDSTFAQYHKVMKPFLAHYTYFDKNPNALTARTPSPQTEFFCPSCHVPLHANDDTWSCTKENLSFQMSDGIPDFVLPNRKADVDRFLSIYRNVRGNEVWGSSDVDYYLNLPHQDKTKKHRQVWKIRARTFDHFARLLDTESNVPLDILDLGAGNCWLAQKLAERGHHLVAVDVNMDSLDGLGVAKRLHDRTRASFQALRAEFDFLPFPAGSFDHIVFNASLHYSRDPAASIVKTLRYLKRGGSLWILDSPIYAKDESGSAMLKEKVESFSGLHGIVLSEEYAGSYLTFAVIDRLREHLVVDLSIPSYGILWTLKPLIARLMGRRSPAIFACVRIRQKDDSFAA